MSKILSNGKQKRKSESQPSDCPSEKRRFSNLTNFKSPKFQTNSRDCGNITNFGGNQKNDGLVNSTLTSEVSTHSSHIVVSQVASQEAFSVISCLKKVLEYSSKDVTERLQLQSVPSYLYDIQGFSNQKDVQLASNEKEYMARNYFEEEREIQFITYVRFSICGQKEFPGHFVLRGILDMILKISDESPITSSQQTILELHNLFTNIITTFPPPAVRVHGHETLRNSYLKMLLLPFKVFGITVVTPERGIFHSMLELLTDLMFHNEETQVIKQTRREMNDQEHLNNFYLWDALKNEKSSFTNFSREEKLDRIFLVLDLIIQVLESDLAMFLIKYPNKLRSSIQDEKTRPLICSILWKRNESLSVVSSSIKTIISTYVNMVGLSYPKQSVQVISRLLNLVSHAVNLYEYPEDTIDYPSYKTNTVDLVREIQKTVEKSVYYSIDFTVNIAKNMRSPLMQMLIVNQFLENIHKVSMPISLEVPFDFIRKKEFAKFKNVLKSVVKNDKKYPHPDPEATVQPMEVTQKDYLELLRLYAGAVNSYYRIKAVLVEAKKHELGGEEVVVSVDSEPFDFAKFEEKLADVDLNEKVELRQVDMNFNKLVHIKLSKETCGFYMKQIKHFWLLIKLIKTCRQRYSGKFNSWMELVDEMETEV